MAGGPFFARLASGLFCENPRDSGPAHNQHLSQQATDEAHSQHDDGSGADAIEQEIHQHTPETAVPHRVGAAPLSSEPGVTVSPPSRRQAIAQLPDAELRRAPVQIQVHGLMQRTPRPQTTARVLSQSPADMLEGDLGYDPNTEDDEDSGTPQSIQRMQNPAQPQIPSIPSTQFVFRPRSSIGDVQSPRVLASDGGGLSVPILCQQRNRSVLEADDKTNAAGTAQEFDEPMNTRPVTPATGRNDRVTLNNGTDDDEQSLGQRRTVAGFGAASFQQPPRQESSPQPVRLSQYLADAYRDAVGEAAPYLNDMIMRDWLRRLGYDADSLNHGLFVVSRFQMRERIQLLERRRRMAGGGA